MDTNEIDMDTGRVNGSHVPDTNEIDMDTGRVNGSHVPSVAAPGSATLGSPSLGGPNPELTDNAKTVLAARYLIRDVDSNKIIETPREMFERVAWAIAGAEDPGYRANAARTFYRRMASLEFLPNTPCLVNAGRPGGTNQFSACFVVPVPDTMDGVFSAIRQMALIHKSGGGSGFSFSRLRAAGRPVRTTSGVASGPISFMRPFNAATEATKQGGVRRGANMGVLRVDHPDILAFIRIKADDLRQMENFNLSVGITDPFMDALDHDREYALIHPDTGGVASMLRARAVWDEIVRCAHTVGDPGLVFLDRVNALDPLTEALGEIESTNPCQPAWATVLTSDGIRTLGDVSVGDRIWSGQRWSKIVRKAHTGVKRVNAYRTRAGTFYGTGNHRVMDGGRKLEACAAESIDVSMGPDATVLFPPRDGLRNRQHVLDGLVLGDGGYHRASGRVFLCAGPDEIEEYRAELGDFVGVHRPGVKATYYEARTSYRSLPRTYDRNIGHEWLCGDCGKVADFLRGLYSANGSVVGNRVTLKATSFGVIEAAQQMLSSLGISSYYTVNKPTDVVHHNGTYTSRQSYDLNIGRAEGRARFAALVGFIQKHKTVSLLATLDVEPQSRAPKLSYDIVEIEEMDEEDVYDITIDASEHTYWTGGLLVANCGEVPLRGDDACSLGSINLDKFVNADLRAFDFGRLRLCAFDAVRFLDNMITLSEYPVPRIREVVDQSRKIGLGVMGWADALIRLDVPYASPRARELAGQVMHAISDAAIAASELLAVERGPFGAWEQSRHRREGRTPRRHATATVIAPTGSISIIAGCSSGIEPLYALSMTRNQAGVIMTEVYPAVARVGRADGWLTDEIVELVRERGTLHGVLGVPDRAREMFSIANEIEVVDHVLMQAEFQKHVEDGVSKTINLRNSATPNDIDGAYRLAWSAGCKGITVYRDGCRDKQVLTAGAGGKTTASAPAPAPVLSRKKIPKGNGRRPGFTFTEQTPFGNAHVTINEHPEDAEPFEVFVRIGKSGSEIMAWTEAFGRATSYLLAMPGPIAPRERLAEIAQQLADIGGGSQVGIGPGAVVSAPDAIAKVFRAYLAGGSPPAAPQDVTQLGQVATPRRARRESTPPSSATRFDLCPTCGKATLVREQRCGTCSNCGFSKC